LKSSRTPVPTAVMMARILLVERILSIRAFSHVEDLAPERQDRLEGAVAALLALPPAESPSTR